jgi:hypothetical protein
VVCQEEQAAEQGALQWEESCGREESYQGNEAKPVFAQFVSIFTAEALLMFYYFDGFPDVYLNVTKRSSKSTLCRVMVQSWATVV